MRGRFIFLSALNAAVRRRGPQGWRLAAALLLAVAFGAADAARAGTISAVSPAGASADATIRITGTGFSTTATQHDVVFTVGAVEQHATPTGVTTVDAASGLRTLTVRVPAGLPIGPVAVRVVNLASGETSAGAAFEHVALALPDVVAAPPGTTQTVSISGSGNAQFAAGSTRVTFGTGVTVTGVTVIDARTLRATVTIAATAAPGPRTVGVITSTQTLVLTGGFTVLAAGAPANRAPTAVPNGPYAGVVGQGLAFSSAGSADPDGDALTYRWDFGDGAVSTDPNPSHAYAAAGTFPVTLVVTDTRGASASAATTATITVPPPTNQPPAVTAGAPQTIALPAAAALAGSATDDGLPNPPGALTLAWAMVSGPPGGSVTFTPPDAAATTASFTAAGEYVLRLTASDGALSASADVAVTVRPAPPTNQPPAVTAGAAQTITLPAAAALAGSATDDGLPNPPGTLTLAWAMVSGPTGGSVTFTPPDAAATTASFTAAGEYVLRLTASDGALSASADVTVTVRPAPPTDSIPPTVTLSAPREALPGAEVTVTATAADNDRVAAVRFEIDDLPPTESPAEPYQRTFNVPALAVPGRTIGVRAIARDPAGNTGRAEALVTIADAPDTEAPVVALTAPPQTAPGARIRLVATATDNVGVAGVVFLVDGREVGSDAVAPYEATWDVPPDAPIGAALALTARATDFAGLTGEGRASTLVTAAGDTTPPAVSLTAPAEVVAGQRVTLSATAQDDGGVAGVTILFEGAPVFHGTAPPYQVIIVVPPTRLPGDRLPVAARAVDLSALEATDAKEMVVTGASAIVRGVISGEAYDDTTGLPLAGAAVRLMGVDAQGRPHVEETTTDERGRFVLRGFEGEAVVRFSRDGWTTVDRPVSVPAGRSLVVFDARLTPARSPAVVVSPLTGGTVGDADAGATIPPGALSAPASLRVVPVGQQGLQGLLPPGWSPAAAVDLWPHGVAFGAPAVVKVRNTFSLRAGTPLVVARWDEAAFAWRAVAETTVSSDAGTLEALVSGTGQYAWLLADAAPVAPPPARPGALVDGVPDPAVPPDATGVVSPQPRILFYQPGVRSDVRASLPLAAPISSGVRLQAAIAERYRYYSGAVAAPDGYTADLVFYQLGPAGVAPAALSAGWTVTPSLVFEPLSLEQGVISVALEVPAQAGPGVPLVGGGGGVVSGPGGLSLILPPGAVAAETPIDLQPLASGGEGIEVPPGLEMVAGARIAFAGRLAVPATLAFPAPAGLTDGSRLLVVRLQELQGRTRLVLVAAARLQGDTVFSELTYGGQPVPLPGIAEAGRYLLVRAADPIGLAVGLVRGVDGITSFQGAIVSADTLPVVSLSAAGGAYAAAGRALDTTFTALDPVRSDSGARSVAVPAGATVALDLALQAQPPRVTTVLPADGAVDVPLTDPIQIDFSEPLDPSSLAAPGAVVVATEDGAVVAGTIALSNGGTRVVFRPSASLAPAARHVVTVGTAVRDLSGYGLAQAFTSRFETLNTNPPPPPPAGSLSATIPGANGQTTVRATQGTAGPRDRVFVLNTTRGTSTPALVEPNGGFLVFVSASPGDRLKLQMVSPAGRETVVDLPRFRQTNPDGSVSEVVGASGGRVEGPAGLAVEIPAGALPDGTVVTVRAVPAADFPVQLDEAARQVFSITGGVELDFGGAELARYVNVSMPATGGETADDQWVVALVEQGPAGPFLNAVDTARLIDGRITTSSPPCPGVTGRGIYGFLRSNRPVGVAYAVTSPDYEAQIFSPTLTLPVPLVALPFLVAPPFVSGPGVRPVCYPVLSGRVTANPNAFTVKVARDAFTLADREILVENHTRLTQHSFARNVLEVALRVAGAPTDQLEVMLVTLGTPVPVTQYRVDDAGSGQIVVRLDADALTIPFQQISIRNVTRNATTLFAGPDLAFEMSVPGRATDSLDVRVVDVSGTARSVVYDVVAPPGQLAQGNLRLRALPGTIDPTQAMIDAWNAANPGSPITGAAVVELAIIDQSVAGGHRIDIPLSVLEAAGDGSLDYAFDADRTDQLFFSVRYADGKVDSIHLPTFRVVVTSRQTGRVIRIVDAPSPPRGQPVNLGFTTGQRPATVLTSGPSSFSGVDPGSGLTFTFSDRLDGSSVGATSVVVERLSTTGAWVPVAGQASLSADGRSITFRADGGLPLGETFRLRFNGVTDVAGQAVLAPEMRFDTFKPRKLCPTGTGSCLASITVADPTTGQPVPMRDVELYSVTESGQIRRRLVALSSSDTGFKVFNVDVTDPGAPIVDPNGRTGGGRGKKRVAVVGPVSFALAGGSRLPGAAPPVNPCDPAGGLSFSGMLAVTTSFTADSSYLSFFDVTRHDRVCDLGAKTLTVTPGSETDYNRRGTVKASGYAQGLAVLPVQGGLAAYAAVGEVGLMAVEVHRNIPDVPPAERQLEGQLAGNYVDVVAVGTDLYAIEATANRLDRIDPNLALLDQFALPARPRRIAFAEAFPLDLDGDTRIAPAEIRDVLAVATDVGIEILDISRRNAPQTVASVTMPGRVRDVVLDPGRRRVYAAGDATPSPGAGRFFIVDLARPSRPGVIWSSPIYANDLGGIDADLARGYAYVTHPLGIDVYTLGDNCCELGIELTARESGEEPGAMTGDRTEVIARERAALQEGIRLGLDAALRTCGGSAVLAEALDPATPDERRLALLEQGSGACVWRGAPGTGCDETYQPGVSDHDIEVLLPPQVPFASKTDPGLCLVEALNAAFRTESREPREIDLGDGKPPVLLEDVTFFPVSRTAFESARLPLNRPPDTGGSDAVGDMGLGRQQLLLKWVLEGEYVRLDDYGAGVRPATVATFNLSGAATGGRNTLAGRDLDAILHEMRTRRLVPRVEGYEWAVLQEFNLTKSGAFVRIRDASRSDSIFRGLFVKQLHDAAKAGIRSALARMVADDYTAQLALETSRSVFRSAAGCITVLLAGEGPTADDPSTWATEPCESFEEYIAAVAARDLQRRGAGAVFTLPEVRLIHRFFRVKSDKPDPAAGTDADADRFVQDTYAFIRKVQSETVLVYLQEIQALEDRGGAAAAEAAQREDNRSYAVAKLADALVNGSIHVVPRVFNRGQRDAAGVTVQMYRQVSGGTGTLARSVPVDLPAGTARPLAVDRDALADPSLDTLALRNLNDIESVARSPRDKLFQVGIKPKPGRPAPPENPPIDMSPSRAGSYEAVVLTIDVPARSVPEANRQDNVASFVYYILDRTPGATPPPLPSDPWPFAISRATLLAPSAECRESPAFVLTQNANNDQVRVSVSNTSGETLTNVTVCSALAAKCSTLLGTLAPGQGGSVVLAVANPPQEAFVDSVVVVTGTRPDGTSVRLTFTDRVFGTASPIRVALYDNSPLAAPDHPWSRWLLSHRPPSGAETPIVGATTDGTPQSVRIEISGLKPNAAAELLLDDAELGTQGRIDIGRLEGGLVDWGTTVVADALGRATAYYTPPAVFLRNQLVRWDFFKQERFARLTVHQSDVGTTTTLIALRRPPVFLVHGLFGDIDVFDRFEPLVPPGQPAVAYQTRKGFDGRFDLFNVGEAAATSDFEEGARILTQDIAYSLAFYLPGYAIGRVDLVGHSMGGVLSRWITNGDPRIRDAVRKIVTINSPLRGSPLADKVVELRDAPTIQLKAMEAAPSSEQFFYDVWKKSVKVALDGQPPGVTAQAKQFYKKNTCASVLQKVGRLPKFNLHNGALDDLQTKLTRPDGSPSAVAQLIAGGIQAPTHSLVTTMTGPELAARATGEVGLLWAALGLLCNLTPDTTTVETTTLLQLGAEAVKTVVSLGKASSKVAGPARVRELLKVWVDTDDLLWKKSREGEVPVPVLGETQNDRIVEYTSQLGGKPLGDPSVTEVVGNDHQEVKVSPEINWRYCIAYDADVKPRFDAGPIVRDYNGDQLPDPACRVIELLEADPRGPLFSPRLVP